MEKGNITIYTIPLQTSMEDLKYYEADAIAKHSLLTLGERVDAHLESLGIPKTAQYPDLRENGNYEKTRIMLGVEQ